MMSSASTLPIQTDAQREEKTRIRIVEVELAQPLPALAAYDRKTGHRYQQAHCLVRLHGLPIGVVELVLDKDELATSDYAPHIWQALGESINQHLQQDGLPTLAELDPAGLNAVETPPCLQARAAFFAGAPFASIIVSTHDRTEQLAQCLPALLSQHYPQYEVLIVDNAPSSSATADLVQQKYGDEPRLRYIREDHAGLSRGLNCGMLASRGEILAFTDDDVRVDAYWLLELARAFQCAPNVNCVTGLVLPQELETPAQILFEQFGGFGKGFQRLVYDLGANRPQQPLYPYTAGRFGTGASMAFRAAFLRSLGGFDPALWCGMDIAAFFQTVKRGHTLVYQPAALAYHTHRRGYADLQRQIHSYGVALTAFLTKSVLERPSRLFEILGRVPYGLFFTLSDKSPKNQKRSTRYPKDLKALELKGMLAGPFVYLKKRRQLGPDEKRALLQGQAER